MHNHTANTSTNRINSRLRPIGDTKDPLPLEKICKVTGLPKDWQHLTWTPRWLSSWDYAYPPQAAPWLCHNKPHLTQSECSWLRSRPKSLTRFGWCFGFFIVPTIYKVVLRSTSVSVTRGLGYYDEVGLLDGVSAWGRLSLALADG